MDQTVHFFIENPQNCATYEDETKNKKYGMKILSQMYAALEEFPVQVSYPAGQPSLESHLWDLDWYKKDHSFFTNYSFGTYTVQYEEVAYIKNSTNKAILVFESKNRGFLHRAFIPQNQSNIHPQDKPYIDLFDQIEKKSKGYEIKNPYYDTISDSIYNLQYYIRNNLPGGSMSYDDAEKLYNQLDEIRSKLVATQNIK